jgi:CHRD domain
MKQPGALIALVIFVAAVSLVVASEQYKRGRSLTGSLSGAAEIPGPGDADGTGSFKVTLNPSRGQVCYELTVANIGTATAAHIHSGAADVAGPVVMMLKAPSNGSSKDCSTLDQDKITDIIKNPTSYYVNVHNSEFPNGAIRGQLGK